MNHRKRTIWTYYLYKATTSNGFMLPFSIIYIQQQGYGLDVIGVTQSAFLFTLVLSELPAGYLADRIGRRPTLALGNGLTVVVLGAYPFVSSASGWVALYVLWGLAWACHSAIGDAWLYDYLEQRATPTAFARMSGRGESAMLATSAIAALCATGLYALNPDLPFLANAALAAVGVPLVLLLPSARNGTTTATPVREVLSVLRLQLSRPEMRWLVVYAALFNVLFSVTRWLEQPALETVGFPIAGLGILYAMFKLVSAGATMTTGWIQRTLGPRRFFLLLLPVCGVAYASILVIPAFVVPVLFLRRTLDSVSAPIRNQYLNDRLEGAGRATVLSGASMVLSLASGTTNIVFGQLAESTGPTAFLPVVGVIVVLVAGVFWILTSPVRPLSQSTTSTSPHSASGD